MRNINVKKEYIFRLPLTIFQVKLIEKERQNQYNNYANCQERKKKRKACFL